MVRLMAAAVVVEVQLDPQHMGYKVEEVAVMHIAGGMPLPLEYN